MKHTLSPRMVQVMRGLCLGKIGKEIADETGVSVRTVESQIQEAKRRMKARNIAHAVHLFTLAEAVSVTLDGSKVSVEEMIVIGLERANRGTSKSTS